MIIVCSNSNMIFLNVNVICIIIQHIQLHIFTKTALIPKRINKTKYFKYISEKELIFFKVDISVVCEVYYYSSLFSKAMVLSLVKSTTPTDSIIL